MTESIGETADEQHHVIIKTTGPKGGEVVLNGEHIENQVLGVNVRVGFGEPHEVVLALSPRANPVTFDGMARVFIGDEPDPGPAAAAFLSAIDAEQLEQAALNRVDLDTGEHGLTKTMLAQLVDWANGRA